MTPPKATPDRKGKVCKPIVYSVDMPRIGQSRFDDIIEFTKVTLEELDRIEEIKRLIDESKTTQED